jgi:hypothetical protein
VHRELNAAIRDIPLPLNMLSLPVDDRGFPVPWFVSWVEGKPDFRIVQTGKRGLAYKQERCWICGGKLGRLKASVVGPMCVVNKVSSEPPSHPECARYAAKACPFLSRPRMRRNEKDLPDARQNPGGIALDRNPGVAAIWFSLRMSKPFATGDGGYLFDLGPVDRVEWYAERRAATFDEVVTSIATGLPELSRLALAEGQEAVDALGEALVAASRLIPPDPAMEGAA